MGQGVIEIVLVFYLGWLAGLTWKTVNAVVEIEIDKINIKHVETSVVYLQERVRRLEKKFERMEED